MPWRDVKPMDEKILFIADHLRCYRSSSRPYPECLPELEYPGYFHCQKVSANGIAYWTGRRIYIGYLLAGERVGLEEVGDGIWAVFRASAPGFV